MSFARDSWSKWPHSYNQSHHTHTDIYTKIQYTLAKYKHPPSFRKICDKILDITVELIT